MIFSAAKTLTSIVSVALITCAFAQASQSAPPSV
jgi:hypothetical protein